MQAVASRDKAKAEAWAAEQGLDLGAGVHGSYEALLADSTVDAVYMPLPTALHLEWVTKAAAAGKHVLIEKPVAVSATEWKTMMAACAKANVVLMDGVMFMHHARLGELRAILDSEAFGTATRIVSGFSFPADESFLASNIRVRADCDPLGCIGDLGWYNVRFSQFVWNFELPTTAVAVTSKWADDGKVPTETSVILSFPGGKQSVFSCGFHNAFSQWVEVASNTSTIRLDDFVIADTAERVEYTVRSPAGLLDHDSTVAPVATTTHEVLGCNQQAAMFDAFAACVGAGATSEKAAFWPRVALQTQLVMDAIMESSRRGGEPVEVAEA